jgi:hypothetical protein
MTITMRPGETFGDALRRRRRIIAAEEADHRAGLDLDPGDPETRGLDPDHLHDTLTEDA